LAVIVNAISNVVIRRSPIAWIFEKPIVISADYGGYSNCTNPLVEKEGKYAVSVDGRHRTAALKGLDDGTLMIWAEVCGSAPLESYEPPRAEWKLLTRVKEFADKISRKFKDSWTSQ
jgi:hypothetical protein